MAIQSKANILLNLSEKLSIITDIQTEATNKMIENEYAVEPEQIRSRLIETKSYGMINCLEVGEYGQPLILVIHGSGPKNSARYYEFFLYEYIARISFLQRFFILAIDCPGYGQSNGSKQAIKTFPRQLLEQILSAINYNRYFILMGNSQGGAAIFNAVFERPDLCEVMVQNRPVCGNIQRFRQFQVPTLLIYDIEDDGHPIWQGKLLYKQLKNSELHTYRSSKTPFWQSDHLWDYILQFIGRWVKNRQPLDPFGKARGNHFRRSLSLSNRRNQSVAARSLDRRALDKPKRPAQPKVLPLQQRIDERSEQSQSVTLEQMLEIQDIDQSYVSSSNSDERQQRMRPATHNSGRNLVQIPGQLPKQAVGKQPIKEAIKPKVEPVPSKVQKVQKIQKVSPNKQVIVKVPQIVPQPTQVQDPHPNRCSLCLQTFFHPIRTNCSHIFCKKCITEAILVNPRCPLCRRAIERQTEIKQLHTQLVSAMDAATVRRRELDFARFNRMMQSIVFVEIGNTSAEIQTKQSPFSKTKKKFNWEVFVVEPRNMRFESVDFNINMGEPNAKPVKVRSAPFVYQSRGTFSFSCEIKICPKSNEYASKVVIYRIDIASGRHSTKIALKKKEFERQQQQ